MRKKLPAFDVSETKLGEIHFHDFTWTSCRP